MGVTLTEDEIWTFVNKAHTGVLTTLRRDGSPIALPVWFAVSPDRRIHLSTPKTSAKVARIAHDQRGSFLVESGLAWAELSAVHLPVRASMAAGDEATTALAAIDAKYAGFRPPLTSLPQATREYYEAQMTVIALDIVGPPLSWDNARIKR